ncbi:unnamed protein product [Paramecium sonneborni]|uniref:BRCT domain-containing protein n=1 Tax=Paramecium sonneborni TaxID=65129 RepID=A0A8S1PR45_9CILI|nr:unnamed protein product [Paramecium sonneborni]
MKPIQMILQGKKYEIPQGITTVGNTGTCQIQISLSDCFELKREENYLWIQPIINIYRINGFGFKETLSVGKEYELDLSTGKKEIIAFDEQFTFEYGKKRIIKIQIIDQNKCTIEPKIVKKVVNESMYFENSINIQKKSKPLYYCFIQNYIKQLNGIYKLKFSNSFVCVEDQNKLHKLGIEIDPNDYNILVMDFYKRTFNLLLALNQGKLIVSSQWIKDCLSTRQVQNPYLYILKTNNFSILKSIGNSISNKIFLDKKFQLSPQLQSNMTREEITKLIEAGGGIISNQQNAIQVVNNGEQGGVQMEEFIQMILYQKV